MGVQVETLTKGKSMHETEYIDFSYNDKKLSDFGLVVVSSGDRLSFGHSPNFEDEVTQVNGSNGQLFWGTHFKNFQRTFHLATDGMSEAQWNAFKRHFIPGQYGEFIEHHLPSRKSYCRVREISVLNIIPFQETITLYGEQVQVNIYKGECSISFEWDDPHYYSISNYITANDWANSKDNSIRAMYTDNVPRYDSWTGDSLCCIGDEEYYLQNSSVKSFIDESSTAEPGSNNTITASEFCFYNPSTVSTDCQLELKLPYALASHTMKNGENSFNISYIDTVGDTYNGNKNDSITVKKIIGKNSEGKEITEEITTTKYTSPNIIYQINKAIDIATNYYKNNITWNILDLEEQLREEITNPKVMGWAANAIRAMSHEKATSEEDTDGSSGGDTGGSSGEDTSGSSGTDTEEDTGTDTEGNAGENTGTDTEGNNETNNETNTEGNTGTNTEGSSGEDTGEDTGDSGEEGTGENTEGNGGENTGTETNPEETPEETPEENNSPEYVLGRYCDNAGVLTKGSKDFYVQLPGENFVSEKTGNWLQFFNSYMLTFFGKVKLPEPPEGEEPVSEEPVEISTLNWLDEGVNLDYENFTLKFDSKLHEAYFSYNYNNIVNELQNISVGEEKCGDIMLSDYLKLDGGDSLNEEGKIATYHTLSFKHGNSDNSNDEIAKAKLIYQYVYL